MTRPLALIVAVTVAPDQAIECFGEEASTYTEERIEGLARPAEASGGACLR